MREGGGAFCRCSKWDADAGNRVSGRHLRRPACRLLYYLDIRTRGRAIGRLLSGRSGTALAVLALGRRYNAYRITHRVADGAGENRPIVRDDRRRRLTDRSL